ncbi:MAG: hypothetical protein RL141_59 [Candidatus Parcubacteria bacterium]|jgi:hypothetical protein
MNRKHYRWIGGAAAAVIVAVLAVWQSGGFRQAEPSAETPPPSMVAETTGSSGPIVYGPPTPARWDWDEIPWLELSFPVPRGHWVYFSDWSRTFYVLAGTPPVRGATAPDEAEIRAKALVTFVPQDRATGDFVSWRSFESTIAEFACVEPNDDLAKMVVCGTDRRDVSLITTPAGMSLQEFTLSRLRYTDRAVLGRRSFLMLQLGHEEKRGILFTVWQPQGLVLARAIARGMAPVSP